MTATSTLGVLETPQQQNEYMLVVSSLDCAVRDRGDWLASVTAWFQAEWIQDVYFRRLFLDVCKLFEAGTPITSHTLASGLSLEGVVFSTKAAEMYGLIQDSVSQGGNIVHYAKEVRKWHVKCAAGDDLSAVADEMRETPTPDVVLERLPEIKNKYASAPEDRSADNAEIMRGLMERMEGRSERCILTFGINGLDDKASLLKPGSLVTVSAPTSGGKSVMLGQIALRCAHVHRKHALVFSYEMTPEEIYLRYAATLCGYPPPYDGSNLRDMPPDYDRKRFIGGLSMLDRLGEKNDGLLHVFSAGSKTMDQIRYEAKAYCATNDVGVVVIDYCQLVHVLDQKAPREQQVTKIISDMQKLAMDTGVTVVTASQVNDDGKTRESRSIANFSNVLLHIEAEGENSDSVSKIKCRVEKNRSGRTGTVYAFWDKPTFLMRDMTEWDDDELANRKRKDYRDYNIPESQPLDGSELP